MTTTFPPQAPPAGPAAVVAAAREVVADLGDQLWAAKRSEELLAVTAEIERLRSTLAAVEARVAVEIDTTDAHKAAEWGSAADYLTAVSGGRQTRGRDLLHTATAICGELELTWRALAAGDISPEHADVIVRVIDKLPVKRELRDLAERFLLQEAEALNATELEKLGPALLERLDPEGVEKREEKKLDKLERSAHLNRFLSIREDGIGGGWLKGRGTVEDLAVIRTTLASLSAPQPSTDPECGLDGRDPRDHGARTWDALVEACQRLQDAEVLPESHGAKPRVIVTTDYDTLRTGLGTATLDNGDTLSGQAVRRLACDADIIPAVLGSDGAVLDVGRTQRLASTVLFLALVLRDRNCAFPGCHRPPIACDAHHIVHWANGGPTSLDNMVLLCRAHHTMIHSTPWEVRLSPVDRRPEFRPPPGRRVSERLRGAVDESDDWIRERRPRQE